MKTLTPLSQKLLSEMFTAATDNCKDEVELHDLWLLSVELGQHEASENIKEVIQFSFPTFYRETWGRYIPACPSYLQTGGVDLLHPHGEGDRFPCDDEQPEKEQSLDEMHEETRRLIEELSQEKDGLFKALDELKESEVDAVIGVSPQSSPARLNRPASVTIAEKVEEERAKLEKLKADNLDVYAEVTGRRKTA